MPDSYNFLLAGVGGQGTLLASNVLAEVALATGYDVKKSEVHGMAQRGGSVNTHIRWAAERVYSPLIGLAEADILLAFEWAEALRYAGYLKPGGAAIVNHHTIKPITVTSGGAHYPTETELLQAFGGITERLHIVPGTAIAHHVGAARVANVVLLGAL
jgi:indolepyruvate ferredoxin oxidoreductase beta subunit